MDYDLIVIGGGSGGIAGARRAAKLGAKVALIEQGRLGGTCVNVGCVPKKIMWHASQIAETAHEARAYGFDFKEISHDWLRLRANREAYIERLNGIYKKNLLSSGAQLIEGRAKFVTAHEVDVRGQRYSAEKILLATGGRPARPHRPGAELGLDSDGFFALDHCPESIAIAGSGYIAVELAGMLRAFGAEVTLIVRGQRLLRSFDTMLADTLLAEMLFDSPVHALARAGSKIRATLGEGQIHDADSFIWAVGRAPNTHDLGLEAVGVEVDGHEHIRADEWQATSAANVFAVGDVTGRAQLTPVAIAAARRLAERLFGGQPQRKLDYELIPTVIFSHPTIGTVGLAEQEARTRFGADVRVYESRFKALYYGILEHKAQSSMKLVCVGPDEKIVGLHTIGPGSDEMLQGFAVALRLGATKRDFDDTVAIHPTSAEEMVTMN
jgi:glutathione reductase (NADPH)